MAPLLNSTFAMPSTTLATLPLLHIIQHKFGYISAPAIEWVAAKLEIMDLVKAQCRKGLATVFISS